jgi:hypothetical protein
MVVFGEIHVSRARLPDKSTGSFMLSCLGDGPTLPALEGVVWERISQMNLPDLLRDSFSEHQSFLRREMLFASPIGMNGSSKSSTRLSRLNAKGTEWSVRASFRLSV